MSVDRIAGWNGLPSIAASRRSSSATLSGGAAGSGGCWWAGTLSLGHRHHPAASMTLLQDPNRALAKAYHWEPLVSSASSSATSDVCVRFLKDFGDTISVKSSFFSSTPPLSPGPNIINSLSVLAQRLRCVGRRSTGCLECALQSKHGFSGAEHAIKCVEDTPLMDVDSPKTVAALETQENGES